MEDPLKKLSQLLDSKGIRDPEIEEILSKLKQPAPESTVFSDNLIYIPMNPIIKEAQDLGGAEAVAFGYNVVGTAFINLFTKNTLALSLAGPLIEKLGFFLWELIKAIKQHKKTGKSIGKEFKANISNGIKNLLVDITIHDSLYAILMAYGISHQLFEPRILAIFSFILALPPAIFVKYSGNELLYYLRKQITKRYGFKREKYYEARFIVDSYPNPAELFQQTAKKFWLTHHETKTYEDTYFLHNIPIFSERTRNLKSRTITDQSTGNSIKNMEITHLLPTKKTEKNSIFNFYYSKKEKGRKDISQENVDSLILKFPYNKSITSKSKEISFNREVYFDKEIRITLDTITSIVNGPTLTYVMEVKVYKDINALIKVMEYIISKGNKHLTTYGKYDLI